MDGSKKKLLASIEKKTELVLKSQKNSNQLIELLKSTSSNKNYVKKAAVEGLAKIFNNFLVKKKLVLLNEAEQKIYDETNMTEETKAKMNAEEKYRVWIFSRYIDFKEVLVSGLEDSDNSEAVKLACLKSVFEFIKTECSLSNEAVAEGTEIKFPYDFFNSAVKAIVLSDLDDKVLKKFGTYLAYADVRFFCLRYILTDFYASNKVDESVMTNLLSIFSIMPELTKDSTVSAKFGLNNEQTLDEKEKKIMETELSEKELNELMTADNSKNQNENHTAELSKTGIKYINYFVLNSEKLSSKSKVCFQDIHRKFFNDCINALLKYKLSIKFYKKLLIRLPEKILPKMSNPLMLADFLTQSYNSGGLISVLALNSLFVLINNFNLEYPHFYEKVYQLLDSSIFSTKYKDRFFQHLDTFLLSTHLSATMVAAFIKKLSRMLLTCPPGDARFLTLFVYNLLIRHKNCKVLIHRQKKKNESETTQSDAFNINCTDYTKCNALKSSLWEIQSLKSHYFCHVSKEVDKLNNLNHTEEYPLDDAFENNSYEELILQELDTTKGTANCALNHHFQNNEDPDLLVYDSNVSNLLKYN